MKRYVLAGVLMVGMCAPLRAIPPTRQDAYDGVLPDARAIALGGAHVAVGGSPSMVVYNPAGLVGIAGSAASVTIEAARQSDLTTDQIFADEGLRDRSVSLIALAGPKSSFSWRPLSNQRTRAVTGADWAEREVRVDAFTVAAAHDYSPLTALGLSLSYLSGRIAESAVTGGVPVANIADGNGVALDLGLLWTLSPQLRCGVNCSNLFGMMWWDDYGSEQLPFGLRAGFTFRLAPLMLFAADWDKRYYRTGADRPAQSRFGLEQMLGSALALRVGAASSDFNDREQTRLSGGIGYGAGGYAFSLAGEKYRVSATDVYRYLFSIDIPLAAGGPSGS